MNQWLIEGERYINVSKPYQNPIGMADNRLSPSPRQLPQNVENVVSP